MRFRIASCILFSAGLIGQTQMPEIQRALERAGDGAAVEAISVSRSEIARTTFGLGQEQWPGGPPAPQVVHGTEVIDITGLRLLTEGLQGLGDSAQPYKRVLTRSGGYTTMGSYTVTDQPNVLGSKIKNIYFSPVRALRTVAEAKCSRSSASSQTLACVSPGVGAFTAQFDAGTGYLASIQWADQHPLLGPRQNLLRFGHYRAIRGTGPTVILPHLTELTIDGRLANSTLYQSIEPGGVPDAYKFELPAPRSSPLVQITEITPSVLYVKAGAYYSLAVVHDGGLVWVDGSDQEADAQAMLSAVRERIPGTRVGMFVATHNHLDHLGSLPFFLRGGASVATHRMNRDLIEQIAVHSSRPSVSSTQKWLHLVQDKLVLGEGTPQEVQLHAVSLLDSATMLMAYLPNDRLLFVADDAEGPPSKQLIAEVRRLGLAVDRLASAHSGVKEWAKVVPPSS